MPWSFLDWSPDDSPGLVLDVTVPGAWDHIAEFYSGGSGASAPLNRIIEIARSHDVVNVVIERRYIDLDWRSEHANFYGHTFKRYPSICHRLHFFSAEVPEDMTDLEGLQDRYHGYTILRPLSSTPVGRTMIAPPPELAGAIYCEAIDQIDIFGWKFQIQAMPFVSQDAEYLRCAHASLCMTLYHGFLRHGLPRRLPSEIHDASMGGVIVGRQVPSEGLSVYQMLAGATALGLSPAMLPLPQDETADVAAGPLGLAGIVCRYINSQLPPIIISNSHAWVMSAYRRESVNGKQVLQFWRHDDARGPYIAVSSPWSEPHPAHRPWVAAIIPLLRKMYVSAEQAEAAGRAWFTYYLGSTSAAQQVTDIESRGDLTYRTFAIRSREYKEALSSRGVDPELAKMYRLANWPRYIWVVEAVDRAQRREGKPDVIGEAIFDSTTATHHQNLEDGLLALHAGDFVNRTSPDHLDSRTIHPLQMDGYYSSGRPQSR